MGFALFTIVDIAYTAVGAFYGGGGAELNPIFAWIHDPLQFVVIVATIKCIAIGSALACVLWLGKQFDKTTQDKYWTRLVLLQGNIVYALLLTGCFALNIAFQLHH